MYFGNLSLKAFKCKNFAFRNTTLLDQMNCTKKQQSLIYETENLFDLIYDNFGLVYFAKQLRNEMK